MINNTSISTLQLWRVISAMNDWNELLHWSANRAIQYAGIQVIQLWTYGPDATGQAKLSLCTTASQDISLSNNVFLFSTPITTIVEFIVKQQNDISPQPVQNIFTRHMATLLRRHSLNYITASIVREDLYLPSKGGTRRTDFAPIPQKLVLLLFLSEPARESVKDVYILLQQALILATRRGILGMQDTNQLSKTSTQGPSPSPLEQFVPRRTADTASSPLALPLVIADKDARSLYTLIDDRKTVGELIATSYLTADQIYKALQFLLSHQRIQLYESGTDGKLISNNFFTRQKG